MDNAFSIFTGSRYRKAARVPTPPTMLTDSEIRLLYWLSKMQHKPQLGAIVELGCWLGGSTVALQRGADRWDVSVRSFDHFRWQKGWGSFANQLKVRRKQPGESFHAEFLSLMKKFNVAPDVTAGDIRKATFAEPIWILFVDIMKSQTIARHVVSEFFTRLVPGALVVHQDFKFKNTWWIQMWAWHLRQYLVPVLNVHDSSTVVFQCVETIPADIKSPTLDRYSVDAAFRFANMVCRGSVKFRLDQLAKGRQKAMEYLR